MALGDDAHGVGLLDCHFGLWQSGSLLAAFDSQRQVPRYRLAYLPTSCLGPSWPAQTFGIARTKSDLLPLLIGQAIAASPAAEGSLNRPWFKEKWHPIEAKVRASGIWRRDPEKHKSGIRVVGIGRGENRGHRQGRFWRILG